MIKPLDWSDLENIAIERPLALVLQRSATSSVEEQRVPDSPWRGHWVPTNAADRKEAAGGFDLIRRAA